MGNTCSCKGCVISCIDKYSDCKDCINKDGKYNEKKPSEIKIDTSINIQNILKSIRTDTEMKRTVSNPPLETKVEEVPKPQITIKVEDSPTNNSKTEILVSSDKTKIVNNINASLYNKKSEDEFEIN